MKLYNNDKNERAFQSFVNFTKKVYDNDFWVSFFLKSPVINFKHFKVGKHIEYMHQKLSKNMLKQLFIGVL